jgi:transcriptional antiterminator RfaH
LNGSNSFGVLAQNPMLEGDGGANCEAGGELKWICLRTHQKREHVAIAHVRVIDGVEVYGPRIRFEKMTRQGKVWFTEALFPSYLFARVNLELHQRLVASAHGVSGIVRFGEKPTIVPDQAIAELRAEIPNQEYKIPSAKFEPGVSVVIGNPLFYGLRALVTQVIPARERIKVLMEFLGRHSEIEIAMSEVLPEGRHLLAS